MEQELNKTLDLLQLISDKIHYFVAEHIYDGWILQVIAKFLFLGLLVFVIDFILKHMVSFIFRQFSDEKVFPLMKAISQSRITYSLAHLITLSIAQMALYSVFWRHKYSHQYLERIIGFVIVIVIANLAARFLKAIQYYYTYKGDYYRIVAINAISQTLKTIGIFIFTLLAISVIFGIKASTILTSLGAITAVLVLVFRDTILGFMTGIHVATSKSLKVGDWIGIPKYNLEGIIQDIDVITTKIANFDKTISTIPTYDLLSTEIRNNQIMAEGNKRRIKRSIIFNINSFKFIDAELLAQLKKVNLLSHYLEHVSLEIEKEKALHPNASEAINGRQLTNIGVFRKYALEYLKQDPDIDPEEMVLVRQLENTPHGLPLEIYCFANKAGLTDFETIQADIFDHLLTAAKLFELEITQVSHY